MLAIYSLLQLVSGMAYDNMKLAMVPYFCFTVANVADIFLCHVDVLLHSTDVSQIRVLILDFTTY